MTYDEVVMHPMWQQYREKFSWATLGYDPIDGVVVGQRSSDDQEGVVSMSPDELFEALAFSIQSGEDQLARALSYPEPKPEGVVL